MIPGSMGDNNGGLALPKAGEAPDDHAVPRP